MKQTQFFFCLVFSFFALLFSLVKAETTTRYYVKNQIVSFLGRASFGCGKFDTGFGLSW